MALDLELDELESDKFFAALMETTWLDSLHRGNWERRLRQMQAELRRGEKPLPVPETAVSVYEAGSSSKGKVSAGASDSDRSLPESTRPESSSAIPSSRLVLPNPALRSEEPDRPVAAPPNLAEGFLRRRRPLGRKLGESGESGAED